MNKAKHKEALGQEKKSRKQTLAGKPSGKDVDSSELLRCWKTEVEQLADQSFQTVEQAVEAIVDRVAIRMNADSATKEFLRVALSSDEALCQELFNLLKIQDKTTLGKR